MLYVFHRQKYLLAFRNSLSFFSKNIHSPSYASVLISNCDAIKNQLTRKKNQLTGTHLSKY